MSPELIATLAVGLLSGSGVIALLIQWLRQRGREPIEQEAILTSTDHTAVESLQISHAALHQDVKWLRDSLSDTREELTEARAEVSAIRTDFHRLRSAWARWWEDLFRNWPSYRLEDAPPPGPDMDYR